MKQLALACLFFAVSFSTEAQFTWVNKNAFPDSSRYSGSCFSVNGMGYIVGGFVSATSLTYTSQVWQYNPFSDNWTRKSNYPNSYLGGQCSVINGIAYKIGSVNSSGYYYSNVYAYDAANDTWTAKSVFPENGIGGNFQFVLNGKIYVGAGARNSNVHGVNSAYSYDPTTDTWAAIAAYPGPPSITVTGFAVDSFGYAGLGGDGDGHFYNAFYKYNPYTNTWSVIDSFPGKGRYAIPVQFVLNGKAYVGAGSTTIDNSTSAFYELSDLYEYAPAQNEWTPVPGIPGPPRYAPAVFSFENSAYIMGGVNSDGSLLFNDVSEFTLCGNVIDTVNIAINDTTQVRINDTLFVQMYDTTHISVTETDTLIIKANLTGVSSLSNSISVKVFPNPAKNHLQVYINNDYAMMSGYVIKITNILSQNVFVSPVNRQQFDIDIGAWGGRGTYALYIVDPNMNIVVTKMIIIQ